MLYKLLGMLVWNGAKTLLRAKYGRTYVPAPVLAGAVVLAGRRGRPRVRQARLRLDRRCPGGFRAPAGDPPSVWDHRRR